MSKLMPPIIAGTLPAFYDNTLTVPFQMNRAVSYNEIESFEVKIKTVQNSRLIASSLNVTKVEIKDNIIIFTFSGNQLFRVGQFYKVQIAYKGHDGIVGFYSSVGVAKYTTKPDIEIVGLESDLNNFHQYSYIGRYSQYKKDVSEKLYSYKFNLYDYNWNLLLTSGEQIHNSIHDDLPYESLNEFVINKDLESDKKYYLNYEITTINGLKVPSDNYIIVQKNSINPTFVFNLSAEASDEENGCIKVILHGICEENSKMEKTVTGSFKLLRAGSNTDYTEWNEILNFNLYNQEPSRELFVDYTIEHGINYKYAIVQYNKTNLWSNKKESNIVCSNFVYAYLYDGERQLKIKYNPKVSSFKNTLLESKVDTIGNKHPFIFRNGNVSYKEFPISGLISLQMDEDNLFYNKEQKDRSERIVEETFVPVEVVNVPFYNYDDIWQELYIKLNEKNYISVKQHCYNNNKNYIWGYDPNCQYYFYDKYLKPSYYKVDKNIYNTKHYLYSDIYQKLYLYKDNKYISVLDYYKTDAQAKSSYSNNERYFLQSMKQQRDIKGKTFETYSLENIQLEREFKLEVLNWLNNGQPKLFRSPVEGNYIVRLMNVSLTPNDTLGRLLHTFNSTAYEIADSDFNTLKTMGMLKAVDSSVEILSWETVDIHDAIYNQKIGNGNLLKYKAVSLRFEGMLPGDKIKINDGVYRNNFDAPGYEVVIGATGSYNIDLSANAEILSVNVVVQENSTIQHQGILTYAYYRTSFNKFDTISTINIIDIPLRQLEGPCDNFLAEFNDIKHDLQKIYFIHAKYLDEEERNGPEGKFIRPIIPAENDPAYALDKQGILFVDGEEIYLKEIKEIFIDKPETFDFKFGENVLVEICYQITEINYEIEDIKNTHLNNLKLLYLDAEKKLNNHIYLEDTKNLNQYINDLNSAYNNFINELTIKLAEQEAIEGNVV